MSADFSLKCTQAAELNAVRKRIDTAAKDGNYFIIISERMLPDHVWITLKQEGYAITSIFDEISALPKWAKLTGFLFILALVPLMVGKYRISWQAK